MSIGKKFQQETKYIRDHIPAGFYEHDAPAPPFKSYPNARKITLPPPIHSDGPGVWDVMMNRRSARAYGSDEISSENLSQLLWAGQGITADYHGFLLRTAPSAGALYPIETYVGVSNVRNVPKGLYHYDVRTADLSQIVTGDVSKQLSEAALGQRMVENAAVVFIWTAVFARSRVKYRDRGYRYVYLDCAHTAQNVLLAVTALGLSACPIAALYDEEINTLLGIDGETESVLYMASIGP
ncbi:MAG: SagB/ThcOx family dehydrogenase [Deltaproteobacteria bacterium]|nr:SagB/ThcOx family dehydrogenase [Candidatus Zymogenaceae bacterium]